MLGRQPSWFHWSCCPKEVRSTVIQHRVSHCSWHVCCLVPNCKLPKIRGHLNSESCLQPLRVFLFLNFCLEINSSIFITLKKNGLKGELFKMAKFPAAPLSCVLFFPSLCPSTTMAVMWERGSQYWVTGRVKGSVLKADLWKPGNFFPVLWAQKGKESALLLNVLCNSHSSALPSKHPSVNAFARLFGTSL